MTNLLRLTAMLTLLNFVSCGKDASNPPPVKPPQPTLQIVEQVDMNLEGLTYLQAGENQRLKVSEPSFNEALGDFNLQIDCSLGSYAQEVIYKVKGETLFLGVQYTSQTSAKVCMELGDVDITDKLLTNMYQTEELTSDLGSDLLISDVRFAPIINILELR